MFRNSLGQSCLFIQVATQRKKRPWSTSQSQLASTRISRQCHRPFLSRVYLLASQSRTNNAMCAGRSLAPRSALSAPQSEKSADDKFWKTRGSRIRDTCTLFVRFDLPASQLFAPPAPSALPTAKAMIALAVSKHTPKKKKYDSYLGDFFFRSTFLFGGAFVCQFAFCVTRRLLASPRTSFEGGGKGSCVAFEQRRFRATSHGQTSFMLFLCCTVDGHEEPGPFILA